MCWTIDDRHSRSPGAVRHINAAGRPPDDQCQETARHEPSLAQPFAGRPLEEAGPYVLIPLTPRRMGW
jgi:hypothetical protein